MKSCSLYRKRDVPTSRYRTAKIPRVLLTSSSHTAQSLSRLLMCMPSKLGFVQPNELKYQALPRKKLGLTDEGKCVRNT